MTEPIDIVINNFTRLQYLDIIVREIRRRTEYPHRLIVVDNATTERTYRHIRDLLDRGLIQEMTSLEENHPLPQSFKRGFELVRSRYFVMTVDDAIPPWLEPCWLTHLVHLIEGSPGYGAIALHYNYADSSRHFTGKERPVEFGLDKSEVTPRHAIEEVFQIQSAADMRTVGFSRKNTAVYEFARRMEDKLGKKVGCPPRKSALSATVWDDEDWGYLPEVKNRNAFYEKKKFRNVRIVACLMAHRDDQFIDRVLDNLSRFTDEFYINLNNATSYTRERCIEHKHTKKCIVTDGRWGQAKVRDDTIRMLDDVRPDIVLFPDSDELYCDNLMEVLEEFWDSHKKACWFEMKYCWGDESSVRLDGHWSKMIHVRAFKWREGLTYGGYRGFACPINYYHEKRRKFISKSPVKHLKYLKKENIGLCKTTDGMEVKTYDKFDNNFGS